MSVVTVLLKHEVLAFVVAVCPGTPKLCHHIQSAADTAPVLKAAAATAAISTSSQPKMHARMTRAEVGRLFLHPGSSSTRCPIGRRRQVLVLRKLPAEQAVRKLDDVQTQQVITIHAT